MSRDYSQKELRILYTQSGNLCAFPECSSLLTHPGTTEDDAVNTSDIAHIVADSRQGPRGEGKLDVRERTKNSNLILLCERHHRIVDAQPHTYSVAVLRRMKEDHQARVARLTGNRPTTPPPMIKEALHSTLFPVTHMPMYVFSAPCKYPDDTWAIKRELVYAELPRNTLLPFILRDGHLFAFDDLRRRGSAFQNVVNHHQAVALAADAFWSEPEGHRRFVTLLNRSLYKYAAWLKICYDPNHKRFYFPVEVVGNDRVVKYRPLNQADMARRVAWLPRKKSTGEPRNFWIHLAAGINFQHVAPRQWCLTIRPERHLTSDGTTPLDPEKIGPRVNRMKAKMYNHGYLTEVQFWRDFLCRSQPRMILSYGEQALICDSTLVSCEVEWPGIPDDHKPYKNQQYEEDLFSLSEFDQACGIPPGEAGDDEPRDEEEQYDDT